MLTGLRDTQEGEAARAAVAACDSSAGLPVRVHRVRPPPYDPELPGPRDEDPAAGAEGGAGRRGRAEVHGACGRDGDVSDGWRGAGRRRSAAGRRRRRRADPGAGAALGLVAPNPNVAKAQDIADRVTGAVRAAAEIDWRYAGILRRLKAEEGLKVPDSTWKDAAGDAAEVRDAAGAYLKDAIPHDASPAERRDWWAGLTQEHREEYLAVYPDQIGIGRHPGTGPRRGQPGQPAAADRQAGGAGRREVGDAVGGLREIDRQLGAGAQPPMFLLGIGDEGNGRAIVSFGNPDTARNVAAYVPGLGTSLDRDFAEGDLKRARDTAIGAAEMDPNSATASIAWLGYDAPQITITDASGNLGVAGEGAARSGAHEYQRIHDRGCR